MYEVFILLELKYQEQSGLQSPFRYQFKLHNILKLILYQYKPIMVCQKYKSLNKSMNFNINVISFLEARGQKGEQNVKKQRHASYFLKLVTTNQ